MRNFDIDIQAQSIGGGSEGIFKKKCVPEKKQELQKKVEEIFPVLNFVRDF